MAICKQQRHRIWSRRRREMCGQEFAHEHRLRRRLPFASLPFPNEGGCHDLQGVPRRLKVGAAFCLSECSLIRGNVPIVS